MRPCPSAPSHPHPPPDTLAPLTQAGAIDKVIFVPTTVPYAAASARAGGTPNREIVTLTRGRGGEEVWAKERNVAYEQRMARQKREAEAKRRRAEEVKARRRE